MKILSPLGTRVLALAIAALFASTSLLAQTKTGEIVTAADRFLATLSAEQRQKVLYAFDDAQQRARWSNFPTGFVPRGGMSLKQMSAPQREAAMKLMTVVLSPIGLKKVDEIRQADDDFKANGSKRGPGPGGPGGPGGAPQNGQGGPPSSTAGGGPGGLSGRPSFSSDDMFGANLYFISFLGKPSTTAPWMLQFGGHHLALNITIDGGKGVLTPTLTGAQPAAFQHSGITVRPLGRESDKALGLLQSLDPEQRRQAVLDYTISDLVLGPGQDGKKIVAEGLKASLLTPQQQKLLLDLIGEWTGILSEPFAATRMQQMKADLNDTWFAWSGPTTGTTGSNISAYYRIQGPHLVIEYAPQHDEPTNHVHTMYRDPTNDYGTAISQPIAQ